MRYYFVTDRKIVLHFFLFIDRMLLYLLYISICEVADMILNWNELGDLLDIESVHYV
jgi:hypothetical protein